MNAFSSSVLAKAFRIRGGHVAHSVAKPSNVKYMFAKPHELAIPNSIVFPPSVRVKIYKQFYETFMGTSARYVTFCLIATIIGERLLTGTCDQVWAWNNKEVASISTKTSLLLIWFVCSEVFSI